LCPHRPPGAASSRYGGGTRADQVHGEELTWKRTGTWNPGTGRSRQAIPRQDPSETPFFQYKFMSRKRSNPERNPGFDEMATAGKFLAQWRSSAHSCDLFLIDPVACGCFEVWTSKNLGMAREGGRDRAVEHPSWTATPRCLASPNKPPPVAPCSCTGSGIRRVVCSWIS
jgi:hypothetical protein